MFLLWGPKNLKVKFCSKAHLQITNVKSPYTSIQLVREKIKNK